MVKHKDMNMENLKMNRKRTKKICGATKQQRYTKFKKPINQQNNEIFCYFIPKQQNEKHIFC